MLGSADSARSITVAYRLGLLQAFLEASATGLSVTTADHRLALTNHGFCEILQRQKEGLTGGRLAMGLSVVELR